jgi:hypothetical protein
VDADKNDLYVVTGRTDLSDTSKGQRIKVDAVHVNPQYADSAHDSALLHLSTPTSSPAITLAGAADDALEPGGVQRVVHGDQPDDARRLLTQLSEHRFALPTPDPAALPSPPRHGLEAERGHSREADDGVQLVPDPASVARVGREHSGRADQRDVVVAQHHQQRFGQPVEQLSGTSELQTPGAHRQVPGDHGQRRAYCCHVGRHGLDGVREVRAQMQIREVRDHQGRHQDSVMLGRSRALADAAGPSRARAVARGLPAGAVGPARAVRPAESCSGPASAW